MKYSDILNAFVNALRPISTQLEEIRCLLAGPVAAVDEEHFFLCDPVTGERVRIVYQNGNALPVSMTYLNGTPYAGAVSTLVECQTQDTDAYCVEVCIAGQTYRQCHVLIGGVPTGLPTDIYYLDSNGVIIPQPAGAITMGPCTDGDQIFKACRCDDVNGDGSLIVRYIEFYTVDAASGTITILSNYTENPWTLYVPVNPVDCDSLGVVQNLVQRRLSFTGVFVWNRPATNVQSVTVKVRNVGTVLPTVTDNAGGVTSLYNGDVETWSLIDGNTSGVPWLTGNFIVASVDANTEITILYTEFV